MISTNFKGRLQRGERLIGVMISLPSPEITELLSHVGFDWLFIDLEHGAIDLQSAQALLQAAGGRVPCLVRVPAVEEIWIKKCLDIGADGLILPQIRSAAQAKAALRWCLYPPEGERSVGIGRAHGYGSAFSDYIARANAEITLVIQIEHIDAARDLDSILALPGTDALLIGPYDLSASMGKPGQVNDPEVVQIIQEVQRLCREAGMPLGIFAASAEASLKVVQEGYRLVAAQTDAILLANAATSLLARLRGA